ncbi:MAG TPA: hypothetical protein VNT02_05700 [Burkholderiales bacterium]|nr:hypothetical protein [Burkholderiales bacterium]
MTTRLAGTLKREISVDGKPYTVTLTETGLTLVPKGRRKGLELHWKDLLSGEQALAVALNASLQQFAPPPDRDTVKRASKTPPRGKRHLRVVPQR